VEFCASEIRDADRQPLGSVLTFRNVTERRSAALAAEAERRYRESEAANRAKDHFLATLSHELRTPMTSILGWVQFLRIGGYTEEELEEALRTIETSARLQARLIDDMLDVSRIVLGKFQIDLHPMKIADIIDPALTTARPAAAECGVKLISHIENPDAYVEADASRMQQVINNILANAIKFSPKGCEVELRVGRREGKLMISVTDQGEGIEPSFLPYVFERLRQGNVSSRSGLGLGLAIARHIVELHHGEITAESEGVGKGARFTVLLPLPESRALREAHPQAAHA
jgi:signal transduction histidine kinase